MQAQYKFSLFGTGNNKDLLMRTQSRVVELSWAEVAQTISKEAFSGQLFNGSRSDAACLGIPSLLVADIDEGLTITEADRLTSEFKVIIATSRHHQIPKPCKQGPPKPACDRFRIIFSLAEPIQSKDLWAKYRSALNLLLNNAVDPAVKYSFHFLPVSPVVVRSEGKDFPKLSQLPDLFGEFVNDVPQGSPLHYSHFGSDGVTKGYLTRTTREFFVSGVPDGGSFNDSFSKACYDCRDQLFSEEEFRALFQKLVLTSSGKYWEPDKTDEAVIRTIYSQAPKPMYLRMKDPRSAVTSYVMDTAKQQLTPLLPNDDDKETPEQSLKKGEIVRRVMREKYLQNVGAEETLFYEIADRVNEEVFLIHNNQRIERFIEDERSKKENFIKTLKGSSPIQFRQFYDLWLRSGDVLQELPTPFKFRGDPGWTLKRMDFDLTPGRYPAWEEYLSRLSHPETFMQWVGSCFDLTNKGRQCLWQWGESGQDGKSKVARVIYDCFGGAAGSINNTHIKKESQFLFSALFGKRFALYADCKHRSFVTSEIFRNITSGDPVLVEFKGAHPFSHPLYVKLLVSSNYAPKLTGINADKSRVLLVKVAQSKVVDDNTWEASLKQELGHFLFDCFEKYKAVCRVGENAKKDDLPMPKDMHDMVAECAEEFEEKFYALKDLYLESREDLDEQECVKRTELYNLFCRILKPSLQDYEFGEFKTFLRREFGVKEMNSKALGKRYKGIKLNTRAASLLEVGSVGISY